MTSRAISRRGLLSGCAAGLAGAAAATAATGCRAHRGDVVRIGFMTNLTHAPVILGVASGRIEKALGVRVESRSFRAGPRVVEALVGDAIDVGVAGPGAIIYTHARHGAGFLRVLSGCASGGASFVVGSGAGIRGPGDLRGKTLATTQIGTMQDIALRKYLRAHGYGAAEHGGEVTVHALDPATILAEVRNGALDGAWLPEPWATRMVQDAGAVRLIDERDLWPGRVFPNAVVACRGDFVRGSAPLAARVTEAIGAEIDRAQQEPPVATSDAVGDALGAILGKPLPRALVEEAWRWVDFTRDPLRDALETIANDAWTLGLAPQTTCSTLFG